MKQIFVLLASCAVLAGCGGDGGSSGGNIAGTSPVAPPTSSPTPPSTGLSTGEVKPDSNSTFLSASMDLDITGGVSQTNGIITGGSTSNRVTALDPPRFSANYGSTAGYSLSDAVNAVIFGPTALARDTTVPNGNGVVLFTKTAGLVEDYLALYQQTTYTSSVKGSGYTTARYGGTAGWQHTVVNGSSRRTRLDYFAYGPATPLASMPRTGVVTFSVLSSGNYATDTDLFFLSSGNGNVITVDFGAGTVSGSVGLAGQNFFKSVVGGIGSFPVNGNFAGNSFSVSFPFGSLGTSGGVPGQFHLLFVGPNAEELVLTYVANDGAQAAVGAAVAVRDPYRN